MLVLAFLWLFQMIAPIITIIGALVLFSGDFGANDLIIGAILAVVGFIMGLTTWSEIVPPRWFWVKSPLELFSNRITNAFTCAIQFFLIPCAITGITMIVEKM